MMDGAKFDREALTLRVRQREVAEHVSEVEAHVAYGYVDHVMDNYSQRTFVPSMMIPNPAASNPDRETLAARVAATLELSPDLVVVTGLDAHDDDHSVRSSMNQVVMPYRLLARIDDVQFRQQGAFDEGTWTVAPGQRWVPSLTGGQRSLPPAGISCQRWCKYR